MDLGKLAWFSEREIEKMRNEPPVCLAGSESPIGRIELRGGRGLEGMPPWLKQDTSRQWGTSRGDIRKDHVERYELAAKTLEGRVLDAACGCGYGSSILHEKGLTVVSVDIEQEAIDWAKKNFPGPQYICGDLEHEPWFGGFDGIAAFEIIEHIEQPRAVLQIFRMSLRGKMVISTPNQERYPFRKEKFLNDKYPHFRHYTPLEFDSVLENAGFEIEQRYSQGKDGKINDGVDGPFIIYVCS